MLKNKKQKQDFDCIEYLINIDSEWRLASTENKSFPNKTFYSFRTFLNFNQSNLNFSLFYRLKKHQQKKKKGKI